MPESSRHHTKCSGNRVLAYKGRGFLARVLLIHNSFRSNDLRSNSGGGGN